MITTLAGDATISAGAEGDCVSAPVKYRDPLLAFPCMRQVLTSPSSTRSMFIIDWSEHLLTTANQQDADERAQLTNLAKAITEQPPNQLSSTAFNNPTGLLVIITPTLGTLPPDSTIMTVVSKSSMYPLLIWNQDEIPLSK